MEEDSLVTGDKETDMALGVQKTSVTKDEAESEKNGELCVGRRNLSKIPS